MQNTSSQSDRKLFLIIAWGAALLISLLPDILFRELTGSLPAWIYWAKVGLIVALLGISLVWKRLRPLWLFFAVLLAVYTLEGLLNTPRLQATYNIWLAHSSPFVRQIGAVQIPRTFTSLILVLIMLALFRSFSRFFLVKGDLRASSGSIPLIASHPPRWHLLGPAIAGAMCLGLLVFTFAFGSLPSGKALSGVGPLVPFILLFALTNSFGEEMLYRAPWLGALEGPLGGAQALLLTAVYFGLGHFYGVPYGVVGVILAFIPGWLMGKSMLETRGFTWAWFIHFCMDVTIFFFIALGSVKPGG
jgi:membrane protease YdiL (CAAX protease family)